MGTTGEDCLVVGLRLRVRRKTQEFSMQSNAGWGGNLGEAAGRPRAKKPAWERSSGESAKTKGALALALALRGTRGPAGSGGHWSSGLAGTEARGPQA